MMDQSTQPLHIIILRLLYAVLVVAASTVGLFILRDELNTPVVALLYLLPVMVSTALWGLGSGIVAAILAFVAFNYFFILPYNTLMVHHTQDLLALIIFLVVAVTISQFLGRAQAGKLAILAREREATRLYELSVALGGLHEEETIAQVLARHIYDMLQPTRVEVNVEPGAGGEVIEMATGLPKSGKETSDLVIGLPEGTSSPNRRPDFLAPLMSARSFRGEIRLWRDRGPLAKSEVRLLHTFTNQGAQALERARLAKTETRAQVLEESDRLKSALLNSVSHELRSPLATIKACISSLRRGEVTWDSEAGRELSSSIEEETDYLNQLVGNLIDMSRIEAGALKPQCKWNALAEIVNGVIARFRQRQTTSGQVESRQIANEISEDLPLVPVDYVLMEQVFTNLISNSLKYSPENTAIRLRAWVQNNQTLFIQVSNQGPPVPVEHLERIFDKFYRVTAADRVTGTGLGLSICKGIIEAHGGRIWAENLPDGFAFNFTLPLTSEGMPPQVLIE
jgi:two-component system sensor histidine kinase KdpD